MERINGWEVAGRVLQAAQHAGSFVKEHVVCGAWGDLAEAIKPPKTPVEHGVGEE